MTSKTSFPTICDWCKHYKGIKDTRVICEAFPDGVPSEIEDFKFDHRHPHPMDNGIQFEKQEDETQWSSYLKSLLKSSPYTPETLFQIISDLTETGFPFDFGKYLKDKVASLPTKHEQQSDID